MPWRVGLSDMVFKQDHSRTILKFSYQVFFQNIENLHNKQIELHMYLTEKFGTIYLVDPAYA